jgi:sulfopyruvate decarboxylase alpha subunit
MDAAGFVSLLERCGFDFFTGVPCSYLAPLCRILNQKPLQIHLPAPREDIALGLAAGAFLGGKLPAVYMQNSGLGYSLEALASLHLIYRIPALILMSHRGPEDPGWEEHQVMGEHTEELLRTFGFPYSPVGRDGVGEADVAGIVRRLKKGEIPYFLLIGRESLS